MWLIPTVAAVALTAFAWMARAYLRDNDVTALLVALARENAELREQLAAAQDMLMKAVQIECDAWWAEAERLKAEAVPAFAFRRRRQGWR